MTSRKIQNPEAGSQEQGAQITWAGAKGNRAQRRQHAKAVKRGEGSVLLPATRAIIERRGL